MTNEVPLLQCKKLEFGYGKVLGAAGVSVAADVVGTSGAVGAAPALAAPLDFTLSAGEVVAVVGANGSGKSTLLKTLAGFVKPLSGAFEIEGVANMPLRERAKKIALVRMGNMVPSRMTAREFVGLGRTPYSNFLDGRSAEDERIVDDALATVGMTAFASRAVAELSDGERSRVYLAEALAQQVQILLLDEPDAFLDVPHSHHLFKMLRTLAAERKMGILVSTHSIEYAEKYCNRMMVIDKNCIQVDTAAEARTHGLLRWTEEEIV